MGARALTRAITITLVVIALGAASIALARGNFTLAVIATVALLAVFASAAGAGRIAGRCRHLEGQLATIRIWGATAPGLGGADVFVQRVWALGAGLHFHVAARQGDPSVHIKVAQPRRWSISERAVTIRDAKYVQLSGATIDRAADTCAIELVLTPPE